MNFLNFVIFVSLLIVNVQSTGFNQSWNDLLRTPGVQLAQKNFARKSFALTVLLCAKCTLPKKSFS